MEGFAKDDDDDDAMGDGGGAHSDKLSLEMFANAVHIRIHIQHCGRIRVTPVGSHAIK